MNVFMIGGTGLLGSAAAAELIACGHQVKSIALPPLPEGAPIPEEMDIVFGNYLTMSDDELREKMAGCDCFIFAAGVMSAWNSPHRFMRNMKNITSGPSSGCWESPRSAV